MGFRAVVWSMFMLTIALVTSGCTDRPLDQTEQARVTAEVRARLDEYAQAVTDRDIDGIMSFWSDSLVFAGDGHIVGGLAEWESIARADNEAASDWIHWTWDSVHVLPLSRDAASATVEFSYGKILLQGDTVRGYGSWTYVLMRNERGWQVYQSNGHHPVR